MSFFHRVGILKADHEYLVKIGNGNNQYTKNKAPAGGGYEAKANGPVKMTGKLKGLLDMKVGDSVPVGQAYGSATHTLTRTKDGYTATSQRSWDKGKETSFAADKLKNWLTVNDISKVHTKKSAATAFDGI